MPKRPPGWFSSSFQFCRNNNHMFIVSSGSLHTPGTDIHLRESELKEGAVKEVWRESSGQQSSGNTSENSEVHRQLFSFHLSFSRFHAGSVSSLLPFEHLLSFRHCRLVSLCLLIVHSPVKSQAAYHFALSQPLHTPVSSWPYHEVHLCLLLEISEMLNARYLSL